MLTYAPSTVPQSETHETIPNESSPPYLAWAHLPGASMNLLIYRGTHEVGGTVIEIRAGGTRLILDVGMPLFGPGGESIETRALRRKNRDDLLVEGALPRVPGLTVPGDPPDAVLLSHAHADHSGLLGFTNPKVPIYATSGTSKLMLAGSIFAGQTALPRERFREVHPGTVFRVGTIQVTAHSVDHSAFDSVAYSIEADGKHVLYSGDLRLHGRKPGMARRLAAECRAKPVDALLLEGTHVGSGRGKGLSEKELEEQIVRKLRQTEGLALAAFSPLNVDRLVTFIRAARRTGRIFVADPYTAFVMHLVSTQCRLPRLSGGGHGVRVLLHRRFEASVRARRLEKVRRAVERGALPFSDLASRPERHLLVFRPALLKNELSGGLPRGSVLFYSYWEGYIARPDGRALVEHIESAGARVVKAHASGHLYPEDVAPFVRSLKPRTVIPIHTFHPREFASLAPHVTFLEDGQCHEVI